MLKLVYTPTSEIKESDLVPGSKWRRVRDENGPLKEPYECVLISDGDNPPHRGWFIVNNAVALKQHSGFSLSHPDESILTWLRRDFERVGEKPKPIKRLEDVDCDHLFAHDKKVYVKLDVRTYDVILCRRIDSSGRFEIDKNQFVRDLGPIEIDDSVKGVGR